MIIPGCRPLVIAPGSVSATASSRFHREADQRELFAARIFDVRAESALRSNFLTVNHSFPAAPAQALLPGTSEQRVCGTQCA